MLEEFLRMETLQLHQDFFSYFNFINIVKHKYKKKVFNQAIEFMLCFFASAKKFGMHDLNFLTLLILQIVNYDHNYYDREINQAQRDNVWVT